MNTFLGHSSPSGHSPSLFFPVDHSLLNNSEDVRVLCDLYDLSDIANESFNLSEFIAASPAANSNRTFGSSRSPPSSLLVSRQISPLLCSRNIDSPSGYVAEMVPRSVYENTATYNDPNFLLVYSQSGLPVNHPTNSRAASSPTLHRYAPPWTPWLSDFDMKDPPRYSEALGPCNVSETFNITEGNDYDSASMIKRGRGRPKKIRSHQEIKVGLPTKTTDLGTEQVKSTEKENLPYKTKSQSDMDDVVLSGDTDMLGEEDDVEEDDSAKLDDAINGYDYPKPPFSYSALVTVALKNSRNGRMTVRDIYNFMCKHFPYFRTASSGWKNSVRHNLSLNPGFLKIVTESGPARSRTACRWTINQERFSKMNDDVAKWVAKSGESIRKSMCNPEALSQLVVGTFHDFEQAVRGVTVQRKNIGMVRRKSPKIKTNLQEFEEIHALDSPASPFSDCVSDFLQSGGDHNEITEPNVTSTASGIGLARWNATDKQGPWKPYLPTAPEVKPEPLPEIASFML